MAKYGKVNMRQSNSPRATGHAERPEASKISYNEASLKYQDGAKLVYSYDRNETKVSWYELDGVVITNRIGNKLWSDFKKKTESFQNDETAGSTAIFVK